jgi:hypothetical protein
MKKINKILLITNSLESNPSGTVKAYVGNIDKQASGFILQKVTQFTFFKSATSR